MEREKRKEGVMRKRICVLKGVEKRETIGLVLEKDKKKSREKKKRKKKLFKKKNNKGAILFSGLESLPLLWHCFCLLCFLSLLFWPGRSWPPNLQVVLM